MSELDECLSLGERWQSSARHCQIDLHDCSARLRVRTPTTAALLTPSSLEQPAWGPDLTSTAIGLALGICLGLAAGAVLALATNR